MTKDKYKTVQDAACIFGCSPSCVYTLVQQKKLTKVYFNGHSFKILTDQKFMKIKAFYEAKKEISEI